MSLRLTGDSLGVKKVPVRFSPGSSNAITEPKNVAASKFSPPKSSRLGGHTHSCYIDDQALVFTSQLPPDITGCPRLKFYALGESESGSHVTVHKNALIDSYYPIIECDYSEDRASEKSRLESSNIKQSEILGSDHTTVTHLQTRLKKSSIDSRTFTIYSCKSENRSVCETDNPQPEGPVDFEESSETLSGLECLCELRKRIEKLEEKLQQTLGKSIEIQKATQNKSRSVQKLFRMFSGAIDRNGKPRLHQLPSGTISNNSDTETENELRSIKKRLHDLEEKLKKEKKMAPRDFPHSTTANSSLLKVAVANESFGGSKMIEKESDYTEPIRSDSDSYAPKKCSFKKKKKKITEGKTKPKVKQTFLSKCKILKTNLNTKLSNVSDEDHGTETQSFDEGRIRLASTVDLTHVKPHRGRNLDPERKKKPRKKRRKKNRNLCKKNSKMNILTEESGERKQIRPKEDLTISWVSDQSQKLREPRNCGECPHKDLNVPPRNLNKSFDSSYENLKTVDANLRKPSAFLKRRNVKIPVLFKEFWESKSVLVERKASTVCLRFAFNQGKKDPLATLKKLVKKLSQTHASPGRAK